MERCDGCKFYVVGFRSGECHRNPPDAQADNWPTVGVGDWCGEFKPKSGETETVKGEGVTLWRYGHGDHFTMSKADAEEACEECEFSYDAPVRGTWTEETP